MKNTIIKRIIRCYYSTGFCWRQVFDVNNDRGICYGERIIWNISFQSNCGRSLGEKLF